MKLLTTILLAVLVALSSGKDTARVPDTTYTGNTVKVEVVSAATKESGDVVTERRHAETLREAKRTADATERLPRPTWVAAIAGSAAFFASLATLIVVYCTSRRQLRAYVHIEHPRVCKDTNQDIFAYSIEYSNYGQTPARNVRFSSKTLFQTRPLPNGFVFPQLKENPRAPIGPQQKIPWQHDVSPLRKSDAEFPEGQDYEYLFGVCVYDDGFTKNRKTNFRLYRKKGEDHFNVDDAGNEAT